MTGRESVPWLQQPLELNDPEVFKLTLKQNKIFFLKCFLRFYYICSGISNCER